MALFFGNSYCNLCQSNDEQLKNELAFAYYGMSSKVLSPPQGAWHSAKMPKSTKIWRVGNNNNNNILSSKRNNNACGYFLSCCDINDINDNNTDLEAIMHYVIYSTRPDINSIFHIKSYYLFSAIQDGFLETVHAEAALILGDVPIISIGHEQDQLERQQLNKNNNDINSDQVKRISSACVGDPLRPIRVIVIKNREVIGLGACIHESRAFIEILEEWAKYKVLSNAFGGTRRVITLNSLRGIGARYARSIKFGGRRITN